MRCCRTTRFASRESADGVRVQAAGSRRGPHRGRGGRWLVAEGQEIAEDAPLVEIQTDKATVEIPSPYAGTVLRIFVAEGEVAPVGTVLVVIGEPGETRRDGVAGVAGPS